MTVLPGNGWYVTPHTYVRRELLPIQLGGRSALPAASDPPKCCVRGYHGSEKLGDALTYGLLVNIVDYGHLYIYRVLIFGDVDRQKDKFCGRERKYLSVLRMPTKDCLKLRDILDDDEVYPTLSATVLKRYSLKNRNKIRNNFKQFLSYFAASSFKLIPSRN